MGGAIKDAARASAIVVRRLSDDAATSREEITRSIAQMIPKAEVIEPSPADLRATAKDLRALAGISPEERKSRVWFETLRWARAWVLSYGRWIEMYRRTLLDRAPTLQTELATDGWHRYDAMTWLEIARELEVIALRIEASDRPTRRADERSEWLTVTEAAKLLQDVVSNLTLKKARARVSGAANRGEFRTNGEKGATRRIDHESVSAWLLKQREKHLASFDVES